MHPSGFVHTFEIDAEHKLHIYLGSITEITADALVSSDDNHLSAGGGVSAAIAAAAGIGIRDIYRKIISKAKNTVGDLIRTSAGALNAQHLYHAITIDFDKGQIIDEGGLRRLVKKIITAATSDGVRSLAMPALGTGAAFFQLDRAASVIISELVQSLAETAISNVTLALVDHDATRVFYEEALRAQADSVAIRALRRREESIAVRGGKRQSPKPESALREGPRKKRSTDLIRRPAPALDSSAHEATSALIWAGCLGMFAQGMLAPKPRGVVKKLHGKASETAQSEENPNSLVEQFPSLVDEFRLAAVPPERPKLVEGLATLILKHASDTDIETELLSNPACRGFRGTVRQRLIEFLYLSERHHRQSLGAALFRNRDLRAMLDELGESHAHLTSEEDLSTAVLRALCFNTLAPPTGTRQHIQSVEAQMEASRNIRNTTDLNSVGNQTGQILERFLHELIALYACLFWGANFEEELIRRKLIDKNSSRSLKTATVGTACEIIKGITKALKKDPQLQKIWKSMGRESYLLLPPAVSVLGIAKPVETDAVLRDIETWRRDSVHDRTGTAARGMKDIPKLEKTLAQFHAFLCTCHSEGFYPDVLRYEGTFENRDGERFVHFMDETGKERKVRTDEKIDPRRHYYCFATNNPVHLWPVLVPKL
jgi:O-acetyl-ADP-ribose deacetylase (regulator of RNase III)